MHVIVRKALNKNYVLAQSIAPFASPIKFTQIHSCRTRFLIAVFNVLMI